VSQLESFEEPFNHDIATSQTTCATVVLAVGDTTIWGAGGRRMPSDGRIVFADFHEVSRELLDELVPHLVVSPILARHFDCVDLAQLLARLRFAGRYRAFGPPLPNPQIITREIKSLVPGLDFDVLPMD
jgi:hypothetical protein